MVSSLPLPSGLVGKNLQKQKQLEEELLKGREEQEDSKLNILPGGGEVHWKSPSRGSPNGIQTEEEAVMAKLS